ncbi:MULTISPECIES: NfeD family protein [unclassified Desulfovibrio]|uniref:NfeD family protein n=1 Tax=unclassified Desulfovibrio TaxID=2593640 RepID=UPI0013EB969D|nr:MULTISPECIES: NfeD family protein [unclassified Desulfovibrio]
MSLPLTWFLLGVAFLAVELVNPTLVLGFFGIGAWVTACAALLGLATAWQIVLFIVASLLALRLLRRRFRHVFGGRAEAATDPHDYGGTGDAAPPHPLAGHTGRVSKPVRPDGRGEVRIDGSFWRAVAPVYIPEGREVRVLGAMPEDSLVLRVEPLTRDDSGAPRPHEAH